MFSYIWPLGLIVLSNILYQICAKNMSAKMDPLASLTVTYLTSAACSAVMYFLLHRGESIREQITRLNWAPFIFGLVLVGLEAGYIYAYKAGWKVSTLPIVQSAIIAVILVIVGYLLYREPINRNKIIGIVLCVAGLFFLNRP